MGEEESDIDTEAFRREREGRWTQDESVSTLINKIKEVGALSNAEIAYAMDASIVQVRGWKQGIAPTPCQYRRLESLMELIEAYSGMQTNDVRSVLTTSRGSLPSVLAYFRDRHGRIRNTPLSVYTLADHLELNE